MFGLFCFVFWFVVVLLRCVLFVVFVCVLIGVCVFGLFWLLCLFALGVCLAVACCCLFVAIC